ncbi:hypothetical protein H6800_03525 [Candidatus Nomurabacteria bacterium]|nr:hypothetical protein [Candidatus Nomurabacteria bacterium]
MKYSKAQFTKWMKIDGLLWLNAFSAISGGLALMAGTIEMPKSYLEGTGFTSFYFPGVILFAVVGGSALFAAIARLKKLQNANLVAVLSGIIMMFWIVGEIVSIQTLEILQAIYFLSGLMIVINTQRRS